MVFSTPSPWRRLAGVGLAAALCGGLIVEPAFAQTGAATAQAQIAPMVAAPAITKQPTSTTRERGQKATFTVKASGAGLTYQWFVKKRGVGKWRPIAGARSAKLVIVAKKANNSNKYMVRVTSSTGAIKHSKAAQLRSVAATTKITRQPVKNKKITDGSSTTLSVTAQAKTKLTYQWYYAKTAGGAWTASKQTGARSAVLTISAKYANRDYRYRVVVKSKTATLTSRTVKLVVAARTTTITKQPKTSVTVNRRGSGTAATVSAKATGTSLRYQWQIKTGDTAYANITGATKSSYTIQGATTANGAKIRLRVTGVGGTKYSSVITVKRISPSSTPAKDAEKKFGLSGLTQGIDISSWQEGLTQSQMNSVNGQNFSFVVLRAGASDIPVRASDAYVPSSYCRTESYKKQKITDFVQRSDCAYSFTGPGTDFPAKVRGSYLNLGHYWFNGYGNATLDANYFVANLKNYEPGDPLVLDVESFSGNPAWTPAKALEFLNRVKTLIPDANLYVYMSASMTSKTYKSVNGSNWKKVAAIAKLWVASWGTNNGQIPTNEPSTGAWKTWSIWQYTSNADLGSGALDRLDANIAKSDAFTSPTPAP